jgi:hypothetical protein
MAAAAQPVDGPYSEQTSWQTLVGDQRYRLFAAGNRRAAIAESVPSQTPGANPVGSRALRGFAGSCGLEQDMPDRMVLLTEVSRVPGESRRNAAGMGGAVADQQWRWEARHRVQPISQMKSYIDEQSGSCVFFLTRSTEPIGSPAAKTRERLVDSAVRMGKSLGLDAKNLEALRVAGLVHELGKITQPRANGEKFYVTADDDRDDGERCRFAECANAAMARLMAVPLCAEHFISTCYERLDWCADRLSERPASEQESEALCSFLHECIEQAGQLTRHPFHQESLQRARLLDILYTATELSRHTRRSARLAEAISVRLRCETPGRPWEESLSTKLISQHGAMFECIHQVKPEDWLYVERADTGRRARARMAWRGSAAAGRFTVALEFVDTDNYWELSWAGSAPGSRTKGATAGA